MRVGRMPFDAISGAVPTRPSLNYQLLALTLAVVYGGVLAGLPLDEFKDRASYLIYAEHSWEIFERYWGVSPLVGLVNEPLWLLINIGLAAVLPPEAVLRTIIFVPATLVAWLVLRQNPRQFGWLLLFLMLPQVVKNHIIHLRQGLAIAVFLAGWLASRQSLRWTLFAATPFIHASFFFVLFLWVMVKSMRLLRLAADLRTLLVAGAAIGVGGSYWLVDVLGARQAELYTASATDLSGLGFAFWALVLIVMFLQGREFLRQYVFEISTIVFFLGTYFFSPVTGRIFESTLLLVLLSGLRLTGWRYLAFIWLFVVYIVQQWLMRIDQSNFGWGLG
ncbi:MAG: hypothetical protein JNJ76_01370 [Candidatus Competibacter sp.]|nr:hypothetical protein [Candidatus Competibacter sp.]